MLRKIKVSDTQEGNSSDFKLTQIPNFSHAKIKMKAKNKQQQWSVDTSSQIKNFNKEKEETNC